MNIAHVAYYANLVLEAQGMETETVAFWNVYPYVSFEPIELRIDAKTSHRFDGKQITSLKQCDMSFDFYITSENEYIIYLNPDDKDLEAFVVIANTQDDVMRFLSDFEEAAAEVAAIA